MLQEDIVALQQRITALNQQTEEVWLPLRQQASGEKHSTIQDLSIPLMQFQNVVVALPLISKINRQQAQQIVQKLQEGVERYQARCAILDLTGVHGLESHMVFIIINAVRSSMLEGTQVILTGLPPSIVHQVEGEVQKLEHIVIRGSLQSGIAHARCQG